MLSDPGTRSLVGTAYGLSAEHRDSRSTEATLGKDVSEVQQNASLMVVEMLPILYTAGCL